MLSDTPMIGPLMVSVESTALRAEEREWLHHPAVGGIIFFSHNYNNKKQLHDLISEVKKIIPQCIFAVDHEGGRVQRFKSGFTHLPPMRLFGRFFDHAPEEALELLGMAGQLIANELHEVGIDTGFSPVLDLFGNLEVIGDRALHPHPEVVFRLGKVFIQGLYRGGILPVGKHFPGHGTAAGDTHHDIVYDDRPQVQIEQTDLKVFADLIASQTLAAVMTAHAIYPQVDTLPASLSAHWLKNVLREQLGFEGMVFSDDLAMRGVQGANGKVLPRRALNAGCDMVLICRHPQLLQNALGELPEEETAQYAVALGRRWRQWRRSIADKRSDARPDKQAVIGRLDELKARFTTTHS